MTAKPKEHSRLNEKTWVPLGQAFILGIMLWGGAWKVATALERIETRLSVLERDRWTLSDQRDYNSSLQWNNKQLPLWVPANSELKSISIP